MAPKSYIQVFICLYTALLFFVLASCQTKSSEEDDKIVATAFDKNLTLAEVESLLGSNMTRQDSFFFIKEYIDNWLQKQVILHYADKSNSGSTDEINKKVEDFREDLIAFEYRKKMLSEKLDTNITLKESKDYYLAHPENFELKQNIIRFVFIKMPIALENKYKFWNKFGKADNEDLANIAVVALKNGGNAYLGQNKWVAFDDILKVVPINTYNQESFINNNRLFKIDEIKYVWYIHILDFRIKDTISPFEFVEENINQILLNKRKIGVLEKIENNMLKKAIKDNQVKVHLPNYE